MLLSWPYVFPSAATAEFSIGSIGTRVASSIGLPDQYGESTLPILPYHEGHTWSITFRNWECLNYDSSRNVRWNTAWALGKSLGLRPWEFPCSQAMFHCISLLSSDTDTVSRFQSAVCSLKVIAADCSLEVIVRSLQVGVSSVHSSYYSQQSTGYGLQSAGDCLHV